MSTDDNKKTILRAYELSTEKKLVELLMLYDPDYIEHLHGGDQTLEQMKADLLYIFEAFPDAVFTVEHLLAEGDLVACQVTMRGTHQGLYMGIPPTGNSIDMIDTTIKRLVHGKFAESWSTTA